MFKRRDRTILESLKEMEKKGFFERISQQEKEDVDLIIKWHRQRQEKRYFLPVNDLLKRIWMRAKSNEIITLISHPIFGTFTAERDKIEVSVQRRKQFSVQRIGRDAYDMKEKKTFIECV